MYSRPTMPKAKLPMKAPQKQFKAALEGALEKRPVTTPQGSAESAMVDVRLEGFLTILPEYVSLAVSSTKIEVGRCKV